MAKELRTAEELSDMIVSALGVREIEIQISQRSCFRLATDSSCVSRRFDQFSEAS